MSNDLQELYRQRSELDQQIRKVKQEATLARNDALERIEESLDRIPERCPEVTETPASRRKNVIRHVFQAHSRKVSVDLTYDEPSEYPAGDTWVQIWHADGVINFDGKTTPTMVVFAVLAALGVKPC